MTDPHLTQPSIKPPTASLTEQPSSTIQAAIRSPAEDGETLKRANACLALYFDPDHDPETKIEVRKAFVRALAHVPAWAMHRGFDAWERSATRRPSPGEIVILAERETRPLHDEIARRKAEAERIAEEEARRNAARITPEAAARIMAEAGMTDGFVSMVRRFPMATSIDKAKAVEAEEKKANPHWSKTAAPDDPRWEILRKSRLASGLVHPQKPQT